MKPPIPYFGGKQRIAAQIVATFPDHDHYIEPYCGGLSVFLAKSPSKIETLNDLDRHLMTFWRVLRDSPEQLMTQCTFTPHARAELALSREPMEGLTDLEIARRVWAELALGRSGRRARTGWRFYLDGESTASPMSQYLASYVRRMPAAADRLSAAQLECRDAIEVIHDYGRIASNLLYIDPPYLGSTRSFRKQYRHEVFSDNDHQQLAEALAATKARIVLSGYHSDLYARLYRDWDRVEISASTQQANAPGSNSRTEVLWLNFSKHPDLFGEPA